MIVGHAKTITIADATGTVTGWFGSSTVSVAASDIQLPSDWNSEHVGVFFASGNTTVSSQGAAVTGFGYSGAGGVSVGYDTANDVMIISGPTGGGGGETRNYFNPQDAYVQVAGQQGNNSMHIQPMQAPNVTFDRVAFPILLTNATNSTGSVTLSVKMGIYTRNDSTLSLLMSSSTTVAATFSGTVNNSTFAGIRLLTMPWSSSIEEGQYYVGVHSRTTSGGANATISQYLASQVNSNFSGIFGAASNATVQYTRGLGVYSATFSTAVPNSIAISQIQGTASIVLRQPIFYFVNGTF